MFTKARFTWCPVSPWYNISAETSTCFAICFSARAEAIASESGLSWTIIPNFPLPSPSSFIVSIIEVNSFAFRPDFTFSRYSIAVLATVSGMAKTTSTPNSFNTSLSAGSIARTTVYVWGSSSFVFFTAFLFTSLLLLRINIASGSPSRFTLFTSSGSLTSPVEAMKSSSFNSSTFFSSISTMTTSSPCPFNAFATA